MESRVSTSLKRSTREIWSVLERASVRTTKSKSAAVKRARQFARIIGESLCPTKTSMASQIDRPRPADRRGGRRGFAADAGPLLNLHHTNRVSGCSLRFLTRPRASGVHPCSWNSPDSAIALAADKLLDAAIGFVVRHLDGGMFGEIGGCRMQYATDPAIECQFAATDRVNCHTS